MATVQKLESNICELNKEFQRQNASSKLNEENLKSREQALLRDREIFAEQLKWERERLKVEIYNQITFSHQFYDQNFLGFDGFSG